MSYQYKTTGVCAVNLSFDVENGKVKNVRFTGGCDGNHSGITSLVEGMEIDDVIKKLKGITCGRRDTSCPDQLARALESYQNERA